MDLPDIGMREILIVAVVVTVAYLALSVLRLVQVSRRGAKPAAARPPAPADDSVEPPPAELAPPPVPAAEQPQGQRHWLPKWVRHEVAPPAAEDVAANSPASFGDALQRSNMEAELQHLRSDVAALREELRLLKTARRVSPQYNEAMLLAQRGSDAPGIAEQCGISVGEAELVLALSRNKQEFDDYGEDDPQRSTG